MSARTDIARALDVPLLDKHLDPSRETIDVLPIASIHDEVTIVAIQPQPPVQAIRESRTEIRRKVGVLLVLPELRRADVCRRDGRTRECADSNRCVRLHTCPDSWLDGN